LVRSTKTPSKRASSANLPGSISAGPGLPSRPPTARWHHALVALGFRELPRNPDGAVGGEAMMGTLKAALRAPALGNKGLINFLNRRAGRGCRVRRHGGSLRVVSVARQRLSAATR